MIDEHIIRDVGGRHGYITDSSCAQVLRAGFIELMKKTYDFADFVHKVVKIVVIMYLVLLVV